MTDQDIIIAVAKLDGWTPNYLTSRDAVIPVIEKVISTRELRQSFITHLAKELTLSFQELMMDLMFYVICASPRQLCIALLKATGEWKE